MFGRRKTGDALGYQRVQTLIGESVQISGTIESTGVIRIDGELKGAINHDGPLVVGPRGRVEATLKAKSVAIAGYVNGDLEVEDKLEILSTGRLYGDIRCGHLVIQEGGVFAGRSAMPSTPNASASATEASGKAPQAATGGVS